MASHTYGNRIPARHEAAEEFQGQMKLKTAKKDLASAKVVLDASDDQWATTIGYYSIFHACRALLLSRGYREKSHECLIIGVAELFTSKGLLPPSAQAALEHARGAREAATYHLRYSRDAAVGVIKDAEQIYDAALGLLEREGFFMELP